MADDSPVAKTKGLKIKMFRLNYLSSWLRMVCTYIYINIYINTYGYFIIH